MAKGKSLAQSKTIVTLLQIYGNACFWCGRAMAMPAPGDHRRVWFSDQRDLLSLDELLPRSRGGRRILTNQVLAHRSCNNERGNAIAPRMAVIRHMDTLIEHGLIGGNESDAPGVGLGANRGELSDGRFPNGECAGQSRGQGWQDEAGS